MAIHRNLNRSGLGGNYTVWWLLKTLKAAGWTVPRSGSGTGGVFDIADVFGSVATGSNQIVGVGSGSETLGNRNCWLVLRDPGGNREIILVRGPSAIDSGDAYWYMGYSKGALFVGGSDAVDATATDEQQVSISGTKASPGLIYQSGSINNILHAAADDVPSTEGEYGFLCLEIVTPNVIKSLTLLDDIKEVATGDPHALFLAQENAFIANSICSSSGFGKVWVDVGGGGEAWLDAHLMSFRTTVKWVSQYAGISKYDVKARSFPILATNDPVGGYLGRSRWLRLKAVSTRDYPDTANLETILYAEDLHIVDLLDGATTPSTI